jgi:hypothetical protein
MRITSILIFCLVVFFSCNKKEVKKENKEFKEPEIEKTVVDTYIEEVPSNTLVFTVQIAALRNPNERLANLSNVNIYQENSLTKYRLGAFDTYEEAKSYKIQLRKTYKDAFIQALKNNEPIHISEALQY